MHSRCLAGEEESIWKYVKRCRTNGQAHTREGQCTALCTSCISSYRTWKAQAGIRDWTYVSGLLVAMLVYRVCAQAATFHSYLCPSSETWPPLWLCFLCKSWNNPTQEQSKLERTQKLRNSRTEHAQKVSKRLLWTQHACETSLVMEGIDEP